MTNDAVILESWATAREAASAIINGRELPDQIHVLDCHASLGDPLAVACLPRIRRQVRRLLGEAGHTLPHTGTFLD